MKDEKREGSRRGDNYEINNRIKKLREEREWTRTALANKIHVSPDLIKKIENSTRRVTVDNLFLFHEVFNVSFDYLLIGKQDESSLENIFDRISTLPVSEIKELMIRMIDLYIYH